MDVTIERISARPVLRFHLTLVGLLQSLGFTWIIGEPDISVSVGRFTPRLADYVEEIIHWSSARGQRSGIARLLQNEVPTLKMPVGPPGPPVVDAVCPGAPCQAVGAN